VFAQARPDRLTDHRLPLLTPSSLRAHPTWLLFSQALFYSESSVSTGLDDMRQKANAENETQSGVVVLPMRRDARNKPLDACGASHGRVSV